MNEPRRISTTELVFDAIVELHALEQIITREGLADHLNLKLSIIDDKLKSLANDGLIARIQRGVYAPVEKYPPTRPISHTELPDGTVVLDIGDDVLKLTPREARTLAVMLGARAIQASQINLSDQVGMMVAELSHRLLTLERN